MASLGLQDWCGLGHMGVLWGRGSPFNCARVLDISAVPINNRDKHTVATGVVVIVITGSWETAPETLEAV